MDIKLDKKIAVVSWMISIRWLYIAGFLVIGILMKILSPESAFFSLFWLVCVLAIFFLFNCYFHLIFTRVMAREQSSLRSINVLSFFQIVTELVFIFALTNFFKSGNVIAFFYFFPIASAAIVFGGRASVITAVAAIFLINFSLLFEYFGYLVHIYIFGTEGLRIRGMFFTISDFARQSVLNTFGISVFYIIIGLFAGRAAQLLTSQEVLLVEKTKKLKEETDLRMNELKELDKVAGKLALRDQQLTKINEQLDKKIKELENSEKSLMRAFNDLQTERKRTEEEKKKTDAIIANFIDPVIVINEKGELSRFNSAAHDVFGMGPEDIGKKIGGKNNYSMNNFKGIIRREYKIEESKKAKKEDGPVGEEVVINFGGKEYIYKVVTSRVETRSGEFIGTMKTFYNLTKEKMLDKIKSEFISIAAHQLRTPLSAIKWVIKMILDGDVGKLTEEQEKFLYKGYQSNERIICLVNDMLNISRIDEGRFGYSFEKSDFKEVLATVADSLEGKIKTNNLALTLKIPGRIPKIYMDKEKMTMVLQNLLENSSKYTPQYGKIEVGVEVGKELLKVKVKDNGVGIPESDQPKLFSKFFRAENVKRMQTEGSGLGLFVVKSIIEKHGGSIICNSKEGQGTEFVFTLPIKKEVVDGV